MARSVRSRGPAVKAQTYAESDDSGGETETEEQEWNEHPANGVGKASSRPSGKYASKRPIRADVGDKENTGDGYVPNGAGGASGSGGKTAVGLKRTETAGKFNDDEAEKRMRRKSAKLLGQQTTTFDSLADSGSGASGLNAGKQPVQLNSVVPAAPIINVPRDVMNSNFEEWMKMATDNVSFYVYFQLLVQPSFSPATDRVANPWCFTENQREQFVELRPNRLFPRHVTAAKQHRQLDQFPTSILYARWVREDLDFPCR